MTHSRKRARASAAGVLVLVALVAAGCVAYDAGDGASPGFVGVSGGYDEPDGGYYGGWGRDDYVGAYREGHGRAEWRSFGRHAYHPAPGARGMPSLAWHGRGDGGHGGGGRGGGGRGGGGGAERVGR